MKAKAIAARCVLIGLALIGLSCSSAREVKLAVVGPLSGNEAKTGQEILNGAMLAAEQWNAAGGVRGRKVTLFSADDGDDPAKAVEVARAVTKKNPLIVIGHVDSSCSLAASKIYADNRIVMISPASTTPQLTEQGLETVHRACGRDDHQGKEAAIWCIKNGMGTRVVVIHENTDYGKGLAEQFRKQFEFLSNQKVLADEEIDRSKPLPASLVDRCKTLTPDLVYFGGLHPMGASLLKALRQAGVSSFFMAGDGCFTEEFIAQANPVLAQGALLTFYPDISMVPGTRARAFADAYAKRFGAPPGPNSIFGYTAATVGLAAAASAVSPISERTVDAALHTRTFETPSGFVSFDEKGDPRDFRYSMWRVDNGKFVEEGTRGEPVS